MSVFQAAISAELWNEVVPEGTRVVFVPVAGRAEVRRTRTRGPAWTVGGVPVVAVEGQAGGVSVRHLVVDVAGIAAVARDLDALLDVSGPVEELELETRARLLVEGARGRAGGM